MNKGSCFRSARCASVAVTIIASALMGLNAGYQFWKQIHPSLEQTNSHYSIEKQSVALKVTPSDYK